jgi:hypothetical protein
LKYQINLRCGMNAPKEYFMKIRYVKSNYHELRAAPRIARLQIKLQ